MKVKCENCRGTGVVRKFDCCANCKGVGDVDTDSGVIPEGWSVYAAEDAGSPELHKAGCWYFQPNDYDEAVIYSEAYESREAAIKGLIEWAATQDIEGSESQ